jgi:hypothetical protein
VNRREFLAGLASLLLAGCKGGQMEEGFLGRKNRLTDVRTIQAIMGTLRAAGGLVVINPDGIYILASDAYVDSRSYKFIDDDDDVVARVGAVHDDAVDDYRSVDIRVLPATGLDSFAWHVAESPTAQLVAAFLYATHDIDTELHMSSVECWVDDSDVAYVDTVINGGVMMWIEDGHVYAALDDNATSGSDVRMQGDYELTVPVSRRASKTNIVDHTVDRAKFAQLKVSKYNSIKKPDGSPMIGLIAEDVDAVFPEVVVRFEKREARPGPAGRPTRKEPPEREITTWDDRQMLVMAISVIQQQERDIADLKARVAALEAK